MFMMFNGSHILLLEFGKCSIEQLFQSNCEIFYHFEELFEAKEKSILLKMNLSIRKSDGG